MAETIGQYLYRIAWSLDKSGAANLKAEGDKAQKSVDGLGKSLDKTEKEAKDLTAAAKKAAPAVRDVGTASKNAKSDTDGLNSSVSSVTSALKRMIGGLASIYAVKRAVSAIINTATQMDALANSAAAVGASASGMARLAYAADLAGLQAGEMEVALKGVRQTAAQAAAGIGAGAKAWKMIGISTRNENGNLKDTTKLIDELGAKFAKMDEGRAQALGKLLKMTPAVITALRNGMTEYGREFDQALDGMGIRFEDAVKAAQHMHAAQSRLVRVMGLVWQGIASRFFKPFADAFDTIRKAVLANQGTLSRFGAAVLQPLAYALTLVANSVSVVSNAISVLTSMFDALGPAAQTAVQVLLWGMAAYALALHKVTLAQIAAMATNPFLWIAAGITAVMLLLDDYQVAMRGGESYFKWDWVKDLKKWGSDIVQWFEDLPQKVFDVAKKIGDALMQMWTDVMDWFSAKWDAFVKLVTGWMPDDLKKSLGIKIEGEAEAPATPEAQRAQLVEAKRAELLATKYADDPDGYHNATVEAEQLVPAVMPAALAQATTEPAATPAAEQAQQPITVTAAAPSVTLPAAEATAPAAPAVTVEGSTPTIVLPEMPAPEVTVNVPPAALKASDVTVQGSQPAPAPAMPTPTQFAQALAGMIKPSGSAAQAAPTAGGAVDLSKIGPALTSVSAAKETLKAAPLGTQNITNNVDQSKHVDAPVTVTNTTNVTVQTMDGSGSSIADQVGGAVDQSNAKLVRDMQSPLAAIASDDDGGMTTE